MIKEEQIREELLASLHQILGEDAEIGIDDNLLSHGLESLPTVRLLADWMKQGHRVSFGDFMRAPTVRQWAKMLVESTPNHSTDAIESPKDGFAAPIDDSVPFDLTDVQYAYWIGRNSSQQLGGVGTHGYVEVESRSINIDRLQQSWLTLLRSHPMLRACYTEDGKQYVLPEPPHPTILVHDLTKMDESTREEALLSTRERLSHRLLDIATGHVVSLEVSLLPQDVAVIHFDIDLLVCDVQSFQIILHDLAHHYATGEAPDTDPSWSLARYLAGHAREGVADIDRDQAYWRNRLSELPGAPTLPMSHGTNEEQAHRFVRRSRSFDSATWSRLREVCEHHATTPAMVLLTAYARTIGQWSENKKFLMTVPLFNRGSDTAIKNVVADFTALTLTSIDQSTRRTFSEDLKDIQASFYEDSSHSQYSAVRVLRDLRASRGEQVLAPVVFSCNLGDPLVGQEFIDTFGEISYMISQTPQVWIDLQVFTTVNGFLIVCDAVEQLFPEKMLDDLFATLVMEIDKAITDDLSHSDPVESPGAQARRASRAEVASWRLPDTTLVDEVIAAARCHPQTTAIRSASGDVITYQDLEEQATTIASALVNSGVGRGALIAVMVERGPRQIIGALAAMMAGGAYVPVSLQQPESRIAALLGASQVTHLITDRPDKVLSETAVQVVDFTSATGTANLPQLHPQDPAYVIYTSGTTGTPKGVEICHGAAWNTISEINRRLGVGPTDRLLSVSSFDFDLSVYDAFGLLSAGGELVTIPDDARRDAKKWVSLVDSLGITIWNSVPTLFEMLLSAADRTPGKLSSIRHVLLSGDWIDTSLPERMRTVTPQAHLLAMGGATEASIWSNGLDLDVVSPEWTSIPYGRPLAKQMYRVVSSNGQDCPDYSVGELWIGGLGVATQYVGDPGLTETKFVISEDSRWYRTGDMGRFWADGTIEFLGRSDNQVKVRGHRIELGEIESACEALLPIERAVCITHQGASSSPSLVTFAQFTPSHVARTTPEQFATSLRAKVNDVLTEGDIRTSVEHDEHLQTTYAFSVMRRWEEQLTGVGTPNHLREHRNRWQTWLGKADEHPATADLLLDDESFGALERFVTPFEQAFVMAEKQRSIAEFIQSPDSMSVEQFLATRPLGRLVHRVLGAVVRECSTHSTSELKILEIGSRRPEASADYAAIAGTSAYVLADPYRHHLEHAGQRVGNTFTYRQLGVTSTPQPTPGEAVTKADLVLCNQTLHQSEDIEKTLCEAWGLSAPGATMVVVEPTAPSPMSDITAAFIANNTTDARAETGTVLLSARSWKEILQRTGWKPVEHVEITKTTALIIAERASSNESVTLCDSDYAKATNLLATRLPEYMLPKRILELAKFPLTSNGKIDRKALTALVPEYFDNEPAVTELPHTATEKRLIDIWDELLHTSSNVNSDYFRLGGDSLTATRLRRTIEQCFGVEFPLENIFDVPLLRDMAARIDQIAEVPHQQSDLPKIVHGSEQYAPFPLTEVQQSYLIGSSGAIELGDVSSHCYFEMSTACLDPERVEDAFNALIKRHPMLRTVVCEDGLSQRVLPEVPRYRIALIRSGNADNEDTLDEIREEMSRQKFDPTQWPCFDVRYVAEPDAGRLLLSFDNLFIDGWSMFHIFREWKQAYDHGVDSLDPAIPYSFKDYVEATIELSHSDIHKRDQAYWESAVDTIYPAPQLPVTDTNGANTSQFCRHHALVDAAKWRRIKQRVREEGMTEAVFLAEVYAEVLARYSDEPRLSINLTRFDRTRFAPEVDHIVGDFTSLSILSVDTQCAPSFRDRAAALHRRMFSNLDHGSVSGVSVQRMLTKQRGARVTMPVVFTCGLGVVEHPESDQSPYLGVIDHGLSQTPQVWMDLQVYEHDGGLMLNMDAVEAIFPDDMVAELFTSLTATLSHLAESPELWNAPTSTIAPTTNAPTADRINDTDRELPGADKSLLGLYQKGLAEHGDNLAVIDATTQWTYEQLNEQSDKWAQLIAATDPAPGDLVGIMMEKSAQQIAAVLGAMKAGCAYLPLSVDQPVGRNTSIINDAGASIVAMDHPDDDFAALAEHCTVITLADVARHRPGDQALSESSPTPSSLAYVIYTSGTTGTPKGVAITHESAVNTIVDVNERLGVTPTDRILGISELNFDLSVYDIFGMFARGATLVLPSPADKRDPQCWADAVTTHSVTLWNSVPALFSMYVDHLRERSLIGSSVRSALLSGDWIPVNIAYQVSTLFRDCTVFAAGGATEASIWSNWYEVGVDDASRTSIPYGTPLANQRMYILDEALNPRPTHVPGDLYIAGRGLAMGYWKDPEKTAASFITHPRTGERMYRTGDKALYNHLGHIIFLGREDGQVKVNGYRIELGEIESTARKFNELRDCVAVNDHGIVLYVVTHEGFNMAALNNHLAESLPAYMRPRVISRIDGLPRSWNGKIDRKSLEGKTFEQPQTRERSRNHRDSGIITILQELLGPKEISIDDDFFTIGADSLTAVRLTNSIRREMSVEISIRDVFNHPTVRELSDLIADIVGSDVEEGEI